MPTESTGAGAVRIDGLRRLRADLKKAGDDLADLKDANARVADLVAGVAADRAPHRSGRLASTVRGNRAVGRAQVRAGGTPIPYAGPIHWGWPARGITGTEFIPAAAQDTEPTWLPLYVSDVEKALSAVAGTY